jgi:secreted trypsin-like serine protease
LDIADTNATSLIDPTLLEPKHFGGLIDPQLLEPRQLALTRSTTQCGCGYSITNPSPAAGRIVGGAVVNPPNSLPYQAYLQACISAGRCFACGATLLNKRYALTANHCVQVGTVVAISAALVFGQQDFGDTDGVQRINVDRIITRDDYNDAISSDNDIAILHLAQDVVFTDKIVPACLPTDTTNTYVNKVATVSGWGATSWEGNTSPSLKSTSVTITAQTDDTCTKYASSGLPMSQMCAYDAGTDSCQGDSGGPLVVMESGRFTIVGVVSYGHECAVPGYAGVYARVTHFLGWIHHNIADGWCSAENPNPEQPAPEKPEPEQSNPEQIAVEQQDPEQPDLEQPNTEQPDYEQQDYEQECTEE